MSRKSPGTGTGTVRLDRRSLVAVLVSAVLCAVTGLLFTLPQRSAEADAVAAQQAAQADLDLRRDRLEEIAANGAGEAELLYARAQELDVLLPQTIDTPALAAQTETLAVGFGLQLNQMTPADEKVSGPLKTVPFEVQVQGPRSAVAPFIRDLTTKGALLTVSELSVVSAAADTGADGSGADGSGDAAGADVTATFTLHAWSVDCPTLQGQQPVAASEPAAQPSAEPSTEPSAAPQNAACS